MHIKSLCYVLGCDEPTIIGTRHKSTGLVVACHGHDPHRHGYGAPFVAAPASVPTSTPAKPRAIPGGLGIKRPVPSPIIPPASAVRRF